MKVFRGLVVALAAAFLAAVAHAAPSIQFVDNMDQTVTLQVVLDATGSIATEMAVEVQATGDLMITGASVNTALFDDANPGSNPFTGTITDGLFTDLLGGQIFASYGAGSLGLGAFDFLTLDYEGIGSLEASGNIAQGGLNNPGQFASIDLIPEPTSAMIAAIGFLGFAVRRRVA